VNCNTEDDPSTVKATFSIKQKKTLNKSADAKQTAAVNTGTYDFSKALLGVSKIEFEMEYEENDDEKEDEIEYKGDYTFDILTGTSSPEIPPVDIEPGVYHELELYVNNIMPSGNSVEINGTYDDGNTNYVFEFSSTMDEEFEIENENGIDLAENDIAKMILYITLEDLFMGVDFSQADVDSDGVIRINSGSNSDMARIIEDNFERVMDFEHDDDDHDDDDDDH
jgi:hypothetical protein